MKRKWFLILVGILLPFFVGAVPMSNQSLSQPTQGQETHQGLPFPKDTPEEAAAWKKIEDILHPGTQIEVWRPLTPAELRQRERDRVRTHQDAQMAAQMLGIVQATRWMKELTQETDRKMADFEKKWKEGTGKHLKETMEAYQEQVARMPQETAAWLQSMREKSARWQEEMEADWQTKRAQRQEDWAKTKARWEKEAAEYREKNKISLARLARTASNDTTQNSTAEAIPLPVETLSLETLSSAAAPYSPVTTGSETATLTIQYEILPHASIEIMGERNIIFSDVWHDPRPQKQVTVRVETNAPETTTLVGYFLGSVGLSHTSQKDKVIPCTLSVDNREVPLSAAPTELLGAGHVPTEANVPLILTLEKNKILPAGTYTATLVFEVRTE